MNARLAVDIGGTFTDVVLDVDGALTTTKLLTTYDDPARAVMDGIDDVLAKGRVGASDVSLVLHGTTLATNALIERRGAKTEEEEAQFVSEMSPLFPDMKFIEAGTKLEKAIDVARYMLGEREPFYVWQPQQR